MILAENLLSPITTKEEEGETQEDTVLIIRETLSWSNRIIWATTLDLISTAFTTMTHGSSARNVNRASTPTWMTTHIAPPSRKRNSLFVIMTK
jgi:hypothetical protein